MRIAPSAGYGYQHNYYKNNSHKYFHYMYPRQRRDYIYRNKANLHVKSQRDDYYNSTFATRSFANSNRYFNRMENSNHSVQGRGVSTDQADCSQASDESHRNRLTTKSSDSHDIDLNKTNFSFLENLVQESVSEKIQSALQQMNIAGQIQQELIEIRLPMTQSATELDPTAQHQQPSQNYHQISRPDQPQMHHQNQMPPPICHENLFIPQSTAPLMNNQIPQFQHQTLHNPQRLQQY